MAQQKSNQTFHTNKLSDENKSRKSWKQNLFSLIIVLIAFAVALLLVYGFWQANKLI